MKNIVHVVRKYNTKMDKTKLKGVSHSDLNPPALQKLFLYIEIKNYYVR